MRLHIKSDFFVKISCHRRQSNGVKNELKTIEMLSSSNGTIARERHGQCTQSALHDRARERHGQCTQNILGDTAIVKMNTWNI